MTMLLEFLERHRARHLFRSSHLKHIRLLPPPKQQKKNTLFTEVGPPVRTGLNRAPGLENGPRPAALGPTQDQGRSFSLS